VVGDPVPVHKVLDPLAKRLNRNGRFYRPLHPIDPMDAQLLSAISFGKFLLQGFRNQDVRKILCPSIEFNPRSIRKACSYISRRLGLLRAHGLIYKLPKTNIWRISHRGKIVTAMVSRLRQSNLLDFQIAA